MTDLDLFAPPTPAAKLGPSYNPDADGPRRVRHLTAVLALMADGIEREIDALRAVGGSSGDRRFRELRDAVNGGFPIAVRRAHGGTFRYRIVPDLLTPEQRDMIAEARRAVAEGRA